MFLGRSCIALLLLSLLALTASEAFPSQESAESSPLQEGDVMLDDFPVEQENGRPIHVFPAARLVKAEPRVPVAEEEPVGSHNKVKRSVIALAKLALKKKILAGLLKKGVLLGKVLA